MDLTTIIAIATIILGIIGTLLKIVWDQAQKRLEALEAGVAKLVTKTELENLKGDLDRIEHQINTLRDDYSSKDEEFSRIIEDMREKLADARETIAGFGSTYISRKEYRENR